MKKQQLERKVKPTERKPVSALGDSVTVHPDPVCPRVFLLHVIAVMSTGVFSHLIRNATSRNRLQEKVNDVIIHLMSAIIPAPCVFFHVFVSDS